VSRGRIASYRSSGGFRSGLIRVPASRAVPDERPVHRLNLQSTQPTLEYETVDSVLRDLRAHGLRISTARRMIVNFLFEAGGPVSAQQIAIGVDRTRLDLASVYRNLEKLEAIGVVRHFHAGHGPGRYVLIRGEAREYLTCDRCGAIEEIDQSDIDPLREDIQQRFGYRVGFSHFPMVGICPRCAD
jgi:Fur family ferric uptake transcriptional regulator